MESKYAFEIYDPAGKHLADLTGRAADRQVVKSRNRPDEISWTVDLAELEAYCRASNISVRSVIYNDRNEVRVRRGKNYLSGGRLQYWQIRSSGGRKILQLRAVGFLALLARRFTSQEFLAMDRAEIAWQLIATTQAEPNGNLGITRGNAISVGLDNKLYVRTRRSDALNDLVDSAIRGFDHEITYDKVYNQYLSIGSDRSKYIKFDTSDNIIDWTVTNDATKVVNELIGIGSGNGTQGQTDFTETNEASQLTHGLSQDFLYRSSSDNQDGSLEDAVRTHLSAYGFPYSVPSITVDGNLAPVTEYGIGDRVGVRISDSDLVSDIDGAYRIERQILNINDNDDERVALEFAI